MIRNRSLAQKPVSLVLVVVDIATQSYHLWETEYVDEESDEIPFAIEF